MSLSPPQNHARLRQVLAHYYPEAPYTQLSSGAIVAAGERFGSSWPAPRVAPALREYVRSSRSGAPHAEAMRLSASCYASDLDAEEITERLLPIWKEMDEDFSPSGPLSLLLTAHPAKSLPLHLKSALESTLLYNHPGEVLRLFLLPARVSSRIAGRTGGVNLGPTLPGDSPAVLETFYGLLDSHAPDLATAARLSLDLARRV